MNHLKKIIFINSLFPYQEIAVKGSLHVVGGNGTGKTSLLRAIAGFYTGGLKNSPNDVQAELHFLPKKNSWIIYEIQGSKGLFTVALNRSIGSPSFYFINGDYEEEIFRQNAKAKSISKVVEAIKSRKLHFIGPIEEVGEYLSILYGGYQGKDKSEFRKYAIASHELMRFVPVLLDTLCAGKSLSFSLIKKIIFRLDRIEGKAINLEKISQSLKGFREDQRDFRALLSSEKEARKVITCFASLTEIEEEELELLFELKRGLLDHQKEGAVLKKEEELAKKALASFVNVSEKIIEQKQAELKELHFKAGELAYKISVAKQKGSYYQREGITDLLNRFEELSYKKLQISAQQTISKTEIEKENKLVREFLEASLLKEQELRLAQAEISQQVRQRVEQEQAGRNRLEADLILLNGIKERIYKKKQALDTLFIQQSELTGKSYFEKEIEKTQEAIFQKLEESLEYRLNLKLGESQLASLQKRRDTELAALKEGLSEQEKVFAEQLVLLEQELESLSSQIANSGRAFMGWLEKNYPNWQQSIGKILKDDVLLSPFLNPGIERINELFYGIQLDLSDLPESELNIAALGRKKEALTKEIKLRQQEHVKLRKKGERQLATREKYFRQKLREQKKALQKNEYTLQQLQIRIKKEEASIEQYRRQEIQERSAELLKFSYWEADLTQSLEKEEAEKEAVKKRIDIQSEKQKSALATQQKHWDKEGASQLKKIEDNWTTFIVDWEKRKKTAFKGKVSENKDMFGWESLQKMIFQYKGDKKDYLDQMPFWEIEEQGILLQIENRESDLFLSYDDRKLTQKNLLQKREKAQNLREKWTETELQWQQFQGTELFTQIEALPEGESETNPLNSFSLLLQKLQFAKREKERNIQELEKSLRKFQAHFSADNSFDFSVNCKNLAEVKKSAKTLKLFWEEEKAQDFEQAIHLKHAELILRIVEESTAFEIQIESIQKRLHLLNQAFQKANVNSSIGKSHFKIKPSPKTIFQALAQIRVFHAAHAQELGNSSLFNQGDKKSLNTDAYHLLFRLDEALNQYPTNSLEYADAYELSLEDPAQKVLNDLSTEYSGLRRFSEIILGISLMGQLLTIEEGSPRIHLLFDQLSEFDAQTLEGICEAAQKAGLTLATAAPQVSASISYDQVFELTLDSEQNREITERS